MIDDDNLRGQFYRIQEQFVTIIFQDVIRRGGDVLHCRAEAIK
jgi:hypothetical protein